MTENRSKIDPRALPTACGDANDVASVLEAVPEALGASLGCPSDAFGQLLAALGSPWAPQDRLWGGIWVSKSRPKRIRTRPCNGLGRPKRSKIDFSSIWGPCGVDFRRFLPELCATKAQKQNLKKESCDPQRTSRLLRGAVASYCSHVFRNDFRTLHVQPFSMRTHKLT